MAVTLTPEEIDEFLRDGHTVIVSSNGVAGYPHSVPMWYVLLDGEICFSTLRRSQKAKNIARDSRVTCLVEAGEAWIDLEAVMIRGRAEAIEGEDLLRRFDEEREHKYSAFRTPSAAMPERSRQHYAQERIFYHIVPERKTVSWWNRKLRMRSERRAAPGVLKPGLYLTDRCNERNIRDTGLPPCSGELGRLPATRCERMKRDIGRLLDEAEQMIATDHGPTFERWRGGKQMGEGATR